MQVGWIQVSFTLSGEAEGREGKNKGFLCSSGGLNLPECEAHLNSAQLKINRKESGPCSCDGDVQPQSQTHTSEHTPN